MLTSKLDAEILQSPHLWIVSAESSPPAGNPNELSWPVVQGSAVSPEPTEQPARLGINLAKIPPAIGRVDFHPNELFSPWIRSSANPVIPPSVGQRQIEGEAVRYQARSSRRDMGRICASQGLQTSVAMPGQRWNHRCRSLQSAHCGLSSATRSNGNSPWLATTRATTSPMRPEKPVNPPQPDSAGSDDPGLSPVMSLVRPDAWSK